MAYDIMGLYKMQGKLYLKLIIYIGGDGAQNEKNWMRTISHPHPFSQFYAPLYAEQ